MYNYESKQVVRTYTDSASGRKAIVEVTVEGWECVNSAGLLMELGAAFVDMIKILSTETEPVSFADFGLSGNIGQDILLWDLVGRTSKNQDKLETKKGDDDAHVA